MRHILHTIFSLIMVLLIASPTWGNDFVAMTAPMPPYSINKGLHVKGIAVDTLAIIMTLSGVPMTSDDVKLMLWKHALNITTKGPHKIMLNVPKTSQFAPLFKWVGPIRISQYVVIGSKGSKKLISIDDLNGQKVGTIRNSLPERALLASGYPRKSVSSSVTHVIPLKKLDNKLLDYFVHDAASTTYHMASMRMNMNKFVILNTYFEEPLYFAFSKDTDDAFIERLNENLEKMKQPGADGKSRFEKIVAKYLPYGIIH